MAEEIGLRAVFDVSQFNKGLGIYTKGIDTANKKTTGFTGKAGKAFLGLGKSVVKFGALAGGVALGGVVALGAGLTAFGVSAVKEGAAFTKAMSNVAAISGAVGKEFGELEKTARDLGRTTKFTATEAAEGMGFLAMAGFEVNEIISAMPGVLNLASAANMDLGRASDIVSNILSGFGQDASQTSRFVDVLAKTAASSNTSVEQLGQGMKFVAPVAEAFGFSVEETSAALGILGDAGLQAGIAGRGLRGVLSKLGAPTSKARDSMAELGVEVFNLDGTMKTLPEIIGEFTRATEGMTEQQKAAALGAIFSRGEIAPLLVLMKKGEAGINAFGDELRTASDDFDGIGFAAGVAAKQLDNLSGDVTLFQSALSGVKIDVFKAMEPILREIVQTGTKFLPIIGNILNTVVIPAFEEVLNAVGKVVKAFQRFGVRGAAISIMGQLGLTPDQIAEALSVADKIIGIINKIQGAFSRFGIRGAAISILGVLGFEPEQIAQVLGLFDKIIAEVTSFVAIVAGLFAVSAMGAASFDWIDIIANAITFVNQNFELFRNVIIGVGAALAAAGIIATIAGIILAINPFTVAIVGIGIAVGVLVTAWTQNWGNIQAIALTALAVLTAVWAGIVAGLQPMFAAFQEIGMAVSGLGITWSDVWNALLLATGIVATAIGVALLAIVSVITGLVSGVAQGLAFMTQQFQVLRGFFEQFVTGVLQLFQGDFQNGIVNILTGLGGTIVTLLTTGLGLALSVVGGFITSVIGFWQGLFQTLVGGSIIPDLINSIIDWFMMLPQAIASALGSLGEIVSDIFGGLFGGGDAGALEFDTEGATASIAAITEATELAQARFDALVSGVSNFILVTLPLLRTTFVNVTKMMITQLISVLNTGVMPLDQAIIVMYTVTLPTLLAVTVAVTASMISAFLSVQNIVNSLIAIIDSLISAIKKATSAMDEFGQKAKEAGDNIKDGMEDAADGIKKLIDKVNRAVTAFEKMEASAQRAADAAKGAGGASGAAGGFGFAKGIGFQAGTPGNTNGVLGLGFKIPQGFGGDSFGPMFAQSGEEMLVTPRGTSIEDLVFSRLASLLGGGAPVQGTTITNIYNFDMTVNTGASASAVVGQYGVMQSFMQS